MLARNPPAWLGGPVAERGFLGTERSLLARIKLFYAAHNPRKLVEQGEASVENIAR
jgi:hypothetical protein